MLIVTNGDGAAARIRALGLDAEVLPWRDVLHDGPVRPTADLSAQSRDRAPFLAAMSGRPVDEIAADLADRDARFLAGCRTKRVELWFEHDLYDQLQLAQAVDAAAAARRTADLHIVQAARHLTEMPDPEFRDLPATALAVDGRFYDDCAAVWRAVQAPDPTDIARLARADLSPPHMADALRRLLAEYPDAATGLPMSLELALAPLTSGPARLGRLFAAMQAAERAAFMGDLSFARLIDAVAQCGRPVVGSVDGDRLAAAVDADRDWFRQEAMLTPFGRDVLAGEANHAAVNGIDRWIGGVHLVGRAPVWRDRSVAG